MSATPGKHAVAVMRIILVACCVGGAAYFIWRTGQAREQADLERCRARYAAARTWSDTLQADTAPLPTPGSRVELWHRCGPFRHAGRL